MRVSLAGTAFAVVVAAGRWLASGNARRVRSGPRGLDAALLLGALPAGVAALGGMSFAGHAFAGGGPIFAVFDWLHLLGVAAWLGTLGGLALLAWHVRRMGAERRVVLGAALARHSRVALVAAPLVVLTGLANSPVVIGSARNIVSSQYGDLILARPRSSRLPSRSALSTTCSYAGDGPGVRLRS
jgi:putative copper export protein